MPAVKKPSDAKTPAASKPKTPAKKAVKKATKQETAGRVAPPAVAGRADLIVDNQGQAIRVADIPKTTTVDTLDAYGTTHSATVVLNGTAFELDPQQVLQLQGFLAGLAVNFTY